MAALTLREGYTVVDTVGEEEEQTHAHVPQQMMVVPLGKYYYMCGHVNTLTCIWYVCMCVLLFVRSSDFKQNIELRTPLNQSSTLLMQFSAH